MSNFALRQAHFLRNFTSFTAEVQMVFNSTDLALILKLCSAVVMPEIHKYPVYLSSRQGLNIK